MKNTEILKNINGFNFNIYTVLGNYLAGVGGVWLRKRGCFRSAFLKGACSGLRERGGFKSGHVKGCLAAHSVCGRRAGVSFLSWFARNAGQQV